MLKKILYQIYLLSLTTLVIGFFGNFFSNEIAFYISFFLVVLGFVIYPEKKDFGTKVGMMLFPILAVIIFNISLFFYSTDYPDGIIWVNGIFSLFCFATSFYFSRKESAEEDTDLDEKNNRTF